jgi:hypothetical protein
MRKALAVVMFVVSVTAFSVTAQETVSPGAQPASPSPGEWVTEPDAYRGLKWGASIADGAELLKDGYAGTDFMARSRPCECTTGTKGGLCKAELDKAKVPDHRVCRTSFHVGAVWVQDRVLFERDSFVFAAMKFDADDYSKMRDTFVEKYGPPSKQSTDAVQNRMGMKTDNETLTWVGKNVTVLLMRFSDTLDKGQALFGTNAYLQRLALESEAEKKKGAKSF